ncbi:MAG: T9SS type A sorting domain-containing protein, partial [Chlorobi bacterium]|nr:T9SS type A sorting domain-containing protein [Chlorobiota bacterium]
PLVLSGELGRVTMGTLLGDSYRIELSAQLILDSAFVPCVETETRLQAVTMQTCVRELRFVRISTSHFRLTSVAPNPATESVTIQYEIGYATPVRIELLDIFGRIAAIIFDSGGQSLVSGRYHLTASVFELPAGTYWCRLVAGHHQLLEPLLLVR